MKSCKYCDRQWSDEVSVCPSCGGNEFEQLCNNCGNAFEGMFCPKCGVRVGQEKKICPRCGKMYYSHACPDCGYVPGVQQSDYLHTPYMPPQPIQTVQKKIMHMALGAGLDLYVPRAADHIDGAKQKNAPLGTHPHHRSCMAGVSCHRAVRIRNVKKSRRYLLLF